VLSPRNITASHWPASIGALSSNCLLLRLEGEADERARSIVSTSLKGAKAHPFAFFFPGRSNRLKMLRPVF
jgi:hypothetical protein